MLDRLFDALVQCAEWFKVFAVVDAFERGVVLRWGRFHREVGPGPVLCIPFGVDHVLVDNVVTRTVDLKPQSLTTKDGKTLTVRAVVTASIRDVRKALLEVENMDHALIDSCTAAVADFVEGKTWDELRSGGRTDELTKACRPNCLRRYGVEIERVQLGDFALCRVIRLQR